VRIPEELKARLLSELTFVIKKVEEEPDASHKLYFLSAAHGAIERVMRYQLENELLIAHAILNLNYGMLSDRLNRIRAGDASVQLPDDWSRQIVEYLSELKEAIEKNNSIYPALEKIIRLAYVATGPGYYTSSYLESLKSA